MLERRLLSGVAALLMGASFIFSGRVSAHNIPLANARSKVREYALGVLDERDNSYVRFHLKCATAFPGHNHFVRCTVKYFSDVKSDAPVTCTENIEVYFQPHNLLRSENYTYYIKHTSRECGSTRMLG